MTHALRTFAMLTLTLASSTASAFAAPKVVASIKPVHSLVASVMGETGEPSLLMEGNSSPHNFSLKPSQAQLIQDADIVFWIGPDLEAFLVKAIDNTNNALSVKLSDAEMVLLRKSDAHEEHGGDNNHEGHDDHEKKEVAEHDDHDHGHGEYDMHIWLDPQNAAAMTKAIAAALSSADPDNAALYAANASRYTEQLEALQNEITAEIASVTAKSFMTYHDAYGYFTARFDLTSAGSISLNPEAPASAEHVKEIRQTIADKKVTCIFSEPQFDPKLANAMADEMGLQLGTLDPLGAELEPGAALYGQLITGLAASLKACLAR